MSKGYEALRKNAACLDLSGRGEIRVTGEDRARLLHAMSTNHVQQLTPGTGCYAFFLNAQGRIQADANILCFADYILLDTEPETGEKLFQHIDRFIIADDVTLEDQTATLASIAVEGPLAVDVLTKAGVPIPQMDYGTEIWGGRVVAKLSASGAPGYRVFCPVEDKPALITELETAGAVSASQEDLRTVRLEHGKPRYGEDILDTTIPQESQQLHGIHFSKGCYLGQEIVERVRSRGHVNKLLTHLRVSASATPVSGTKVFSADKEAGEITSAAYSAADAAVHALAHMRAQFLLPNATFSVEGNPAQVVTGSSEPLAAH
jgi:folate-binding protein YgfZ